MKKQFVLILPAQKEMAELPLKLRGELWELVGVLEEKGTLAFPQDVSSMRRDESSRFEHTMTANKHVSCTIIGTGTT